MNAPKTINIMHFMRKTPLLTLALFAIVLTSCRSSHLAVESIIYTNYLLDSRYDSASDTSVSHFLQPYKSRIDSILSPVVGRVAKNMSADRPESELSNLLADILLWSGSKYNESPVLAVYNMGGIRASLTEGDVTVGDIIDVAPFDNKVCFMTLTGNDIQELFRQIAKRQGEGVSRGVRAVITDDGRLLSLEINGKAVNTESSYRIVTSDYLAEGNDGLTAFCRGTQCLQPTDETNSVRNFIMDYFREKMAAGQIVDSNIEQRIILSHE